MKSGRYYDLSGSPGYPSPLDCLRTGKKERAAQFGLTDDNEESFECNQSFPRALQMPSKLKQSEFSPDIKKIKELELSSVSFLKKNLIKNHNSNSNNVNSNHNKTNYLNETTTNCNQNMSYLSSTFDKSWAFYNHFANINAIVTSTDQNYYLNEDEASNGSSTQPIIAVNNPNKALVVINGRTTEILTANNISCELFGYSENKLIGTKLKDLLDLSEHSSSTKKIDLLMESDRLDENGRIVLCSGKIFDAFTIDHSTMKKTSEEEDWTAMNENNTNKLTIPISMYMLKLTDEAEPKCLCVMEPVQRITGNFSINVKGRIRSYNSNFSYIFGYTNLNSKQNENAHIDNTTTNGLNNPIPTSLSNMAASSLLVDKDINELIPSMKLPIGSILQEIKKQTLTGRSCNGENIPLKVTIINKQLLNEEIVYNCLVSVYINISGLVTVNSRNFLINSYNATFSRLMFGFDEKELINKPITYLIPNFFEPDTTSTCNKNIQIGKMTPLGVNNSYLNVPDQNASRNCSFSSKNLKQLNSNGSFLESIKQASSNENITGKLAQFKLKQNDIKENEPSLALTTPSLIMTQTDNNELNKTLETDYNNTVKSPSDLDKTCARCGVKLKQLENLKRNFLIEFNLKSVDYSPNQKCANFIESNSFSPLSSFTDHQLAVSNQSSAKKSLLVKAISNNTLANERSNLSMDDLSIVSSSSSSSSCSSLNSSPCKQVAKTKSYSYINVSEFENETEGGGSDQMCESCAKKVLNDQPKLNKEMPTISNSSNNINQEGSEVSLITIENYDECDDHDQNELDSANKNKNFNKRKVSLSNDSVLTQNADLINPNVNHEQRRSSFALDTEPGTTNQSKTTLEKNKKFKNQVTSTPAAASSMSANANTASKIANSINNENSKYGLRSMPPSIINTNDGMFFGRGRHTDGSFIRIFYQRKLVRIDELQPTSNKCLTDNSVDQKQVQLKQQQQQQAFSAHMSLDLDSDNSNEPKDLNKISNIICVWISRDPYSDKSILDYSLDQSQLFKNKKLNYTFNNNETNSYLNEYDDISTLGRGASGFVQLARRKIDRFEVVTKYILKSKIYKENWIEDERYIGGKIPLECSILCKLDHPNIIKVLEVFQDDEYVQMVMEKHGCGMDLFEFIDRQKRYIDEHLASYIFRQIVSAVAYLHSNNLVHRDIKDENIVINEKFHVKLIDFGSAAYMTKGKKFATFCGTLDYCSPDVLLGNKYYGPELDVWTCGIALYTLVFSENPFFNAEETIECILKPPFKVSKELMKLLFSILSPKPEMRASIEEIQINDWVNQPVDINNYKWEEVIRDTEFNGNNAGDFNREEDLPKSNAIIKQEKQEQHFESGIMEKINLNALKQNEENVNPNILKTKLNQHQIAILSKSF